MSQRFPEDEKSERQMFLLLLAKLETLIVNKRYGDAKKICVEIMQECSASEIAGQAGPIGGHRENKMPGLRP